MFGLKKRKTETQLLESKYGIVQRKDEKCGLFSYFITLTGGINYCLEHDLIPIIDMASYKNMYQGDDAAFNSWELFFEQPCNIGLSDASEGREYVDCNKIPAEKRPNLSMDFVTNQNLQNYWRNLCRKYIRLNSKTKQYVDQYMSKYLPNDKARKTVGVLCRGTDYVALRPLGHPVQPDADIVIDRVKEVLEQYNCINVFLATEDEEICQRFLSEFGTKLIVPKASRYLNTGDKYLADINSKMEYTEIYDKTRDYLASIYALSKCNCLVAGRTSGSISALILSEGYEYSYMWNLGKYGVDDEDILNKHKFY